MSALALCTKCGAEPRVPGQRWGRACRNAARVMQRCHLLTCDRSFAPRLGPGRPRKFCSATCRVASCRAATRGRAPLDLTRPTAWIARWRWQSGVDVATGRRILIPSRGQMW